MKRLVRKEYIKPNYKCNPENLKENPADKGVVPNGYATGDEFEKRVNEKVNAYCKKNGVN
ncbi:MAG: hypothetical protein ACOYOT_00280 [Bacteroidales bacterium]